MRHRPYKFITLFLALLLAASSWTPLPGRAEAQMRCAGAPPKSAPCARAELPAAGLTQEQVYGTLMSCCRSMRAGHAPMQGCPMRQPSHGRIASLAVPFPASAALSTRPCVVSIRVSAPVPTPPAVHRFRWLLTASPTLAPPQAALIFVRAPQTVRVAVWTHTVALPPHASPALHGLRAPPAA